MTEIELFDGTVLEFPEGTSQDVIDRVARQETMSRREGQSPQGGGQEGWFSDVRQSMDAGAARGVAALGDLPSSLAQLGAKGVEFGYEKLTGREAPEAFTRELVPRMGPVDLRRNYGTEAMNALAPDVMSYDPQTRGGQYARTATEFGVGATALGGPQAALRYGVLPGVASEAAGQATEGTAAEPYARAAAAIGTSLLASPRPSIAGRRAQRIDPERASAADDLMRRDVKPTAGQILDSESLMRAENTLGPTTAQLDDFTAAALRTAGNTTARRATPQVLRTTQNSITKGMNDILNVDVPISQNAGPKVLQVADDYFAGTAGRDMPVALRRISDELADVATRPGANQTIPAGTLRKWRTSLGAYTTSSQEASRDAAHALREIIDDLTEDALRGLGRNADIAKLDDLRKKYRNFLVIADAATRGGREGASGLLTPERLAGASKRVMGRTNYATGRATDLAELARQSEMIIGSAPTVKPGGIRDIVNAGTIGGAGGLGALQAGAGVPGALGAAAVGATLPFAGQQVMRSNLMQTLIRDPALAATQPLPVLPGLLSVGD